MSDSRECPSRYQWYVCHKGPFEGCCALDPCSTGFCPAEYSWNPSGGSKSSSSRTAETSTSTSTSTLTPLRPETTIDLALAPTSSSASATFTTSTISPDPTTTTPTAVATQTSGESRDPTPSNNKGALIGGIVGGVIGLLLLVILAIFLVIRCRKRRRGEQSSILGWQPTRKPASSPAPMGDMYAGMVEKHDPDSPTTLSNKESLTDAQGIYGKVDPTNRHTTQARASFLSDKSTLVSSPNPSTKTPSVPSSETHSPPLESGQAGLIPLDTLSEHPSSRDSSSTNARAELFAPVPHAREAASELADSDENPRHSQSTVLLRNDQVNGPPDSTAAVPPLTITTPEGVVLRPNMNNRTAEPGEQAPHVMSFMDYRRESG